jgi:hypothetical protein
MPATSTGGHRPGRRACTRRQRGGDVVGVDVDQHFAGLDALLGRDDGQAAAGFAAGIEGEEV